MNLGLFPGQGISCDEVLRALPRYDPLVLKASEILEYDLYRRVAQACRTSQSVLTTSLAQPAIFVAGSIAFRDKQDHFDVLLGHSLGEYTALSCAGAFTFDEGLRLVHMRGAAMQRAATLNPGGMVALLSIDTDAAEDIARRSNTSVANFNSPQQHVLAGRDEDLAEASRLVRSEGGRAVLLPVNGPFHTDAMGPAVETLTDALVYTTVRAPKIPVVSGVTAEPYRSPGEIRKLLLEQLTTPINFTQAVTRAVARGATEFCDLGPGRVVGDLALRTLKALEKQEVHSGT